MVLRMSEIDLNEFKVKRGKKKSANNCPFSVDKKSLKKLTVSKCPHKAALEYLAKHPEDIKGKYEHYEQVRIFYHYTLNDSRVYESLVAIPNGGKRAKKTAMALNAEGLKASYPDILLDIAKGGYFGLRLELKRLEKKPVGKGKGGVTPAQQARLELLHDNGYYSIKAWGHKEAIRAIDMYMLLPNTEFKPMVLNNDFN